MSESNWYNKGIRFKCTGCGKCCCDHDEYSFVYLGQKDIEAISNYLGLSQSAFLDCYCHQEADDFIHLKMNGPNCPFLEDGKCIVYKVRPIQCNSWPFWKDNLDQDTWEKEVKPFCPGIDQGRLYTADEIDKIVTESESIFDEPL
jgi:uncharacterized protein